MCKPLTNEKMRKVHTIFGLVAMTLFGFAVSCVPVDLTPRPVEIPGFEKIELEDHCITLRLDLSSSQMQQTKAGSTERGLNDLNENRVNTIDCFFYETGKTDQAPIFRAIGRTVEENAQVPDSTECFVKVYYNDDIAETLFGSTTDGTCEVFVIANVAINYPSRPTVDDLRKSLLEYDFSQQEVQPYFAMCSQETAQVTLFTENNISTAAGRVPMYRCAAKAQLFLRLPDTFNDIVGGVTKTFEPCPELPAAQGGIGGIQVRLSSGFKKTCADWDFAEYLQQQEPPQQIDALDYIQYSDRDMSRMNRGLVRGEAGHVLEYNYSHTPFYSYPMTWSDLDENAANYIFSIPWREVLYEADGVTVRGYGDPERRYYKISANVIGRKFEANGFYRTFVNVLSRGAASLATAELIDQCYYVVTPWVHEGLETASGVESISGVFIRYNFLVVEPDEVTLNNEADYTFKFSSSADLEGEKVIIKEISYIKYTTGTADSRTVSVGNTNQITNTAIDKNEYKVTYNYGKGEIYFHHDLDEVYEQRDIVLTVSNQDNISQTVTIHQKPAIMLQTRSAGDVFVNGYFGRVENADYGGRSSTLTATYYTRNWMGRYSSNTYTGSLSPYYHCNVNLTSSVTSSNTTYAPNETWYYYSDGNYYNLTGSYSFTWSINTEYGTVTATTNNMNASISANFFTTEINVSAFNANNHTYVANNDEIEYRIGDPRVKASADVSAGGYGEWSLSNYLAWNGSQTTTAWTNPGDILICSMRESDRNLIAPRFLISSALNANLGLSWEQAVMRGATYQEAGYPAGRWRLPSEAEIAFIVARQRDGVIPNLYATNTYYWAGSGRLVYVPTNQSDPIAFYSEAEAKAQSDDDTFSCRFVYDFWYWGDTPAATNAYHPNGHNTEY